jgi:hypothetical protein
MKTSVAYVLALLTIFALALAPSRAYAGPCTTASTAGDWAYTYTGTVFTTSGPLPGASVGHFHQDGAGNVNGSQVRSVAGDAGLEQISGLLTVNHDCSATATINVFAAGVLQRTAVLQLIYDSNRNHVRMIFQSLTLPDGTNVPVVITVDGNRVVSRD